MSSRRPSKTATPARKRASARPKAAAATPAPPSREMQLRETLEERRRALMKQMHGKIRDVRADAAVSHEPGDQDDTPEADSQEDLDLTVIQMHSETLRKIDAALRRLDQGAYGNCFECGEPIAEARLRALPFAVRCKECEEAHEAGRRATTMRRAPGVGLTDW